MAEKSPLLSRSQRQASRQASTYDDNNHDDDDDEQNQLQQLLLQEQDTYEISSSGLYGPYLGLLHSGNFQERSGNQNERSGNFTEGSGNYQGQSGNFAERSGNHQERSGNFAEQSGSHQERSGNYQGQSGNHQEQSGNYKGGSGYHAERSDIHEEAHKSAPSYTSRCHLPRVIEPVVFLFYLAYNCTTPIQEQFVNKLVKDYYRRDLFMKIEDNALGGAVPGDGASQIGVGAGQTCSGDLQGNSSSNAGVIMFENLVQSEAALWLLYIKLAGAIPAMFAVLIICSYGDIGGRKLGLLLPPAGCALKCLAFILAMYLDSPVILLFIGNFIEGMFGSHLTYMGSSYAYLADCTTASERPLRFTILQCSNVLAGLAHIPFGYWMDWKGFRQPFWFVAGVHIFVFLYTLLLIPESHPPALVRTISRIERSGAGDEVEVQVQVMEDHSFTGMFSRAASSFYIYSKPKHGSRRQQVALILLFIAFMFRLFFEMGKSSVETLFMLGPPLCLTSTVIGYFNAVSSFTHGVFGFIGTALFLRCFSESPLAIFFTASIMAARFLFAFTSTVPMLFLVPFVGFGSTSSLSLVRAMMSKLISPQQQGALFATIFSMESVCEVFSGAVFNSIYAATVAWFRGFVFIVQAAVIGVAVIILMIQACVVRCGVDGVEGEHPEKLVVPAVAVKSKVSA